MTVTRHKLIKTLKAAGCEKVRDGARHELWQNAKGELFPVPRGTRIKPGNLRAIYKQAGIKSQ